MSSETVGGVLGAIVGSAILVVAIAYGPMGQMGKPQKQIQKLEPPRESVIVAPSVRGPVVRELPQ